MSDNEKNLRRMMKNSIKRLLMDFDEMPTELVLADINIFQILYNEIVNEQKKGGAKDERNIKC